MALRNKALFVYGLEITTSNFSIDFRGAVTDTSDRQASLNLGFYSLGSLAREIKRALEEADPLRTYTVTVNRNVLGGLQNRFTIASNGAFFELRFGTGPRVASSVSTTIGFVQADTTGATSYTGGGSAGTRLVTELPGYNYIPPTMNRNVMGSVNLSASGLKEAIVWSIQKFLSIEFKYEPQTKVIDEWLPFFEWAIRQRPFEITPDYTLTDEYYEVTLERTEYDGKGLGFKFTEQLPDFPFFYRTGALVMRQSNEQEEA